MSLSRTRFRDKRLFSSKIANFPTPHVQRLDCGNFH